MTIKEAVIFRINELCDENGFSLNRLSNVCGITQSTMNNIISGRNNSTTAATIQKICDGLGITIREFFSSPIFDNIEQEIK